MKKFFLITFIISIASNLSAQTSLPEIYTPRKTDKKLSAVKDITKLYHNLNSSPSAKADTAINGMPVIGKIKDPVFVFNNGAGLDVYQSPLDRMDVAKPDSTFQSNMPVKPSYIITP